MAQLKSIDEHVQGENAQNGQPQNKIHFTQPDVNIHPSSKEGIQGCIYILEKPDKQVFLAWTPYYMLKQNRTVEDAKSSSNPSDLYAIQVPLKEVRSIKRYMPTFKVHYLVIVSDSGVAFPPYYFASGGMKEFFYALKSHVNLVKSDDDPYTFFLTDLDEPMSLLRSSYGVNSTEGFQDSNRLSKDEIPSSALPTSSMPASMSAQSSFRSPS